jgi:hypothetical protein
MQKCVKVFARASKLQQAWKVTIHVVYIKAHRFIKSYLLLMPDFNDMCKPLSIANNEVDGLRMSASVYR